MDTKIFDIASNARSMAAVTFHYNVDRLKYLNEVVRSFAAFPIGSVDVVVFTNTSDKIQLRYIDSCLRSSGANFRIAVASALSNPFELTWVHKSLILQWVDSGFKDYTHFIYVEDDERFGFENFIYWLGARKDLRDAGLLPSFVRTEWNSKCRKTVSADSFAHVKIDHRSFVQCGTNIYTKLDNHYCGAFVLDKECAEEYVVSKSFDVKQSSSIMDWEVRERAAAGLTWEAVPESFLARTVVSVSDMKNRINPSSYINHLPNTYADNSSSPFGKIPIDELLVGDFGNRRS